jgi:hypothetical protein
MAVLFVFGKPGGGKSLFAFRRVIDELTQGTRPVITNLPILPDRLNEWLQGQGYTVDLHRRLRLIDTEQLVHWWRYRGRAADVDGCPGEWVTLPEPVPGGKDAGPTIAGRQSNSTDFSTSPGPVVYVLDEIHTAFNARAWMNTGLAAIWYLSQHRKVGDTVYMISQTPGQVDKQLRSMSQEWIHLTNLSKLKTLLLFTLPQRILWRSYAAQPAAGEPVLATGILRIESPGWADCYNTAAGNSIVGTGNADAKERQKGLPWWLLVLVPFLLFAALFKVDDATAYLLGGFMGKAEAAPSTAQRQTVVTNAPPAPPQAFAPIETQSPAPIPPPMPAPERRVTGWARVGGRLQVFLSDGRTVSTRNGLTSWDGNCAMVDGERWFLSR